MDVSEAKRLKALETENAKLKRLLAEAMAETRVQRRLAAIRGRQELCRQPAMRNGRCRIHGGKATGPRTAAGIERIRRASTKHGRRSKEAIAERKRNAETRRRMKLLVLLGRQLGPPKGRPYRSSK